MTGGVYDQTSYSFSITLIFNLNIFICPFVTFICPFFTMQICACSICTNPFSKHSYHFISIGYIIKDSSRFLLLQFIINAKWIMINISVWGRCEAHVNLSQYVCSIMIDNFRDNINKYTSLKHVFSSINRNIKWWIEPQYSKYYSVNNYTKILHQYRNYVTIKTLNIHCISAKFRVQEHYLKGIKLICL